MKKNRQFASAGMPVLFLLAVSLTGGASIAWGAIVQTNSVDMTSELAYSVSGTDLINTGQSTFASVTHVDFVPADVQDIANLNDGGVGISVFVPIANGYAATKPTVAGVDSDWTSTFDLSLGGAPLGYDITSVQTFSGWPDRRSAQRYDLLVSLVGDASFTSLGVFSVVASSDTTNSTRIALTDTTGTISSGVDAIRFHFLTGTALIGAPAELLYRELDVYGAPTKAVPEPCGLALFAVGLAGMTAGQRRKR
jgi:hypothetical protein